MRNDFTLSAPWTDKNTISLIPELLIDSINGMNVSISDNCGGRIKKIVSYPLRESSEIREYWK